MSRADRVKTITITEYQALVSKKEFAVNGNRYLEPKLFERLENFILSNNGGGAQSAELMKITVRKGAGKVIVAQNYVGVVSFGNGVSIEILPKIVSANGDKLSEREVKRILIKMLKSLKNTPFKTMQSANVDALDMHIFEIFIRMFIDEVFDILRRGLVGGYKAVEGNENFFKGKLLVNKHIKANAAHAERFYVEYEEFNFDRAENRLIKSTLKFLQGKTNSSRNKADINALLAQLEEISESTDVKGDFERAPKSRNNAYYQMALSWARVFLNHNTLTSFSGSEYAYALLFPMEKLFESYVAKELSAVVTPLGYSLSPQDRGYYLFEQLDGKPNKAFALQPDIVITKRTGGVTDTWIMDTKWKVIDDAAKLSQGDMYQMYAYHKKYEAHSAKPPSSVTLIYPHTANGMAGCEYTSGKDGVRVKVRFVDLSKPAEQWTELLEVIGA